MRQNFNAEELEALLKVKFLIGSVEHIENMKTVSSMTPFDEKILDFLNSVSKNLMGSQEAKSYPDVATLGFWLRRASLMQLSDRYGFHDEKLHLGRGIAFHIAPSNVPVNFAYSLFTGLMTGNSNIVRVPSKEFPQVALIANAIEKAFESHKEMRPYIVLVRYGREKEVNDVFSAIADTRIIWGGDATIADIRRSSLPPRSTEVTFADRFSFAVIDSDAYLNMVENGQARQIAQGFYNDTYLTDQNACTSPRLVVWVGNKKEAAKGRFWKELHSLVEEKYQLQPIMAVNKLTSAYLAAVDTTEKENVAGIGTKSVFIMHESDNLITRVQLRSMALDVIGLRESCGFFFEYDTDDLMDLKELCMDKRVQTVGIIGDKHMIIPLLKSGVKGIDQVTDIGHTMDFDLTWDGYNLMEKLTRTINIR